VRFKTSGHFRPSIGKQLLTGFWLGLVVFALAALWGYYALFIARF
jgi:hypothetical protein